MVDRLLHKGKFGPKVHHANQNGSHWESQATADEKDKIK